jgi:o-succinylbenzoate synthase
MRYQFGFRPYQRKFIRPLATNHGYWHMRQGVILRLKDETGKVGWGEIAPISWFGSETLEQALDFCCQLPDEITDKTIFSIPDNLPACQFGFESATWEMGGWGDGEMGRWGNEENHFITPNSSLLTPNFPLLTPNSSLSRYSALLPAGEAALSQWKALWREGYRTFKWKIAVSPPAQELEIFTLLTQALPIGAKLRLDANGGLSYEEANLWLEACDDINANSQLPSEIEFIEQPLSVGQFEGMLELSDRYNTAIALDESVATLNQLKSCFQQGWRGIFVIKPGIVGSPSRLREFCQQHEIDTVFSSVFETAIARFAALELAAELSRNRALGFGVKHWFEEEEEIWLKNLWNNL